ncbi:MAG: S9 family peptidase [Micrococcus sp.]|nr:S9 family peptidase [Micrococcus sp.]
MTPARTSQPLPTPPVADVEPQTRTHHGDTFTDDFAWMADTASPRLRTHLEAENAYTEAVTADQQPLREAIYAEIKGHTVETDQSVPARRGDWWYFTRMIEGQQYGVQCRVPAATTGDDAADFTPPVVTEGTELHGEQVLLDGNALAEGESFFALGGMHVSEDARLLAYAVDVTGDERFTLRIKDLDTGEHLSDEVANIAHGVRFDRTGTRVFYTLWDDSWRPYRVMMHTLGTSVDEDELLYEEPDAGMWTGFEASADRTQLMIVVGNSEVAETRVIDLPEQPGVALPAARMLVPRAAGMLAQCEPLEIDGVRHVLIVHDKTTEGSPAPNGMVSLVTEAQIADLGAWRTVVGHREDVKVDGITVNARFMMLSVRRETTPRVLVAPLSDLAVRGEGAEPAWSEPNFDEELYTCHVSFASMESPLVRLTYTSWISPARVLDLDPGTGELMQRREVEVPGYEPGDYVAERLWAPASAPGPDGADVQVPLTLIRRRDVAPDGTNPALIYGYGSYEMSMDPGLSVSRLSLLDRGVVFVVAHVRGGGELGRGWYEDGKKLAKPNTFTDFVDVTRHVVDTGWADPARIACLGGSAGGLLIGAVLNLAPELYRAAIAAVPFVDALTTILNPELPLSALEWEEWGNPITDADVYACMQGYTPYENVLATAYPAIAAVTSLHDTRVLCVEPAKWVAQLRRTVTSDGATPLAEGGTPILLRTEMDGGHGGGSGRYQAWEDTAWEYAFLLTALGAGKRRAAEEGVEVAAS